MTDINSQSRRRFLKNMATAGAMLPFAGSLLGANAFAAGSGYKNVLFIYHPNGNDPKYWNPTFTGRINTSEELSFGLGALKQHHNNMMVFKNIAIDVEVGGYGDGGGHRNSMMGCLTGDFNSDSPSIDHLIAEKLGNQGVLNLGVRTGSSTFSDGAMAISRPRGSGIVRVVPNNNPYDVATKLSARLAPEPGSPLQDKIYAANLADMGSLPKAKLNESRQGKIQQHENALKYLKSKREEGSLRVPFNFDVKETLALDEGIWSRPDRIELIEQFPALAKAHIDNAVAAFANKLYRVATLQLSIGDENSGRVNYSFEECWNMMLLARDRQVGTYLPNRYYSEHSSVAAMHSANNGCSFQGQVRWHFSLLGYALEKLKSAGILDETLVVTVTDQGNSDHELSHGGIVVAGGAGGGLPMGQVIDCGSVVGGGTHKLYGDIARLLTGTTVTEGPWKSGII